MLGGSYAFYDSRYDSPCMYYADNAHGCDVYSYASQAVCNKNKQLYLDNHNGEKHVLYKWGTRN